jgi:hypothetical protein
MIYQWTSGAPMTIVSGADRALTGLAGQPADRVSDDIYQDQSGSLGSQYFNRAAFATPALGTYGSSGFFSVRGFANWSIDAALSRVFNIGAAHRLEARIEAFNLTNAVRPVVSGVPAAFTNLSSSTFGRVTAVQDPRIMQFALKYVF